LVGALVGQGVASLIGGSVFTTSGLITIAVLLAVGMAREFHLRRHHLPQAATFAARLRELEETNRLLTLTETTANVGHWRLDLGSNKVFWSDGCCSIHGLVPGTPGVPPPLEDAINFYHPDDRALVAQAVETARATGEPFTFRARLIRADGELRDVESTALVEFDDEGKVGGLFGVLCDRSGEEAMQRELIAARETSDALADARSSFLAKMSHELRTPMNGVLGFAELLSLSALTDEQRRHVDLIKDSGKTLQTILNDILDLSKVEAGHLELREAPTDIVHLAEKVTRLSLPAAQEKNLDLRHDIAPIVPSSVVIDALRLRQILGNIIANAVRFTDKGTVRLTLDSDGRHLIFAISDTGIGIPPTMQAAIFDPFTQDTERMQARRGGTGLGLSISRQLAKLMGGHLTVTSEVGAGSTFTLTLPLVPAPAAPVEQAPDKVPVTNPCAGCSCRILLAEDFDINQELITAQGKQLGLTFEVVANGEEALAAVIEARKTMRPYSLVLMDLQMPQMDGLTAARAIREAGFSAEDLPIVALTANAFADDIEACRKAGMQEQMAKPLELARLSEVMRRWLRGFETSDGGNVESHGGKTSEGPHSPCTLRRDRRRDLAPAVVKLPR
jgi:signal transduction histidine kinase/DNA-binding NarL/FixJ family response regulator